jgi:sulfide:quinone oxidoreductase
VLIAGGGVAAVESLLALRELAGPRPRIEMLVPEGRFVLRPMSVSEPFDGRPAEEVELSQIAADCSALLRPGSISSVDVERRVVATAAGEEVEFDTLLVAVGARACACLSGAIPFRGQQDTASVRALLDELGTGQVGSVAFALPFGVNWTLPAYELALLTRAHATGAGRAPELTVVTGEERPLELFGPAASETLESLLAANGVTVRARNRPVAVGDGVLHIEGGASVSAERVVMLPRLEGPRIAGLPSDPGGFIPTDRHGRVRGASGVFAAGDATAFPLKQGGLATQQADAAAEAIAADLGADVDPQPFHPLLRGLLLTGGEPTYLQAQPRPARGGGGDDDDAVPASATHPRLSRADSSASATAPWSPLGKVPGRYLGPYLAARRQSSGRPA